MAPKTPNKRKSQGVDSVDVKKVKTEPSFNLKKVKTEPQAQLAKTPKKEQAPNNTNLQGKSAKKKANKSPKKQNQMNTNIKTESPKKQTPKVKIEKSDTPSSPAKLEMFTGTSKLNDSVDTSKNNANSPNKKKNKKNKKSAAKKDTAVQTTIKPAKKRRDRRIILDDINIDTVTTQIEALSAKGDLSKTALKKLRYLWKLKKNLEAGDPLTKPKTITEAEVPNKKKAKNSKKIVNGKSAKKQNVQADDYDVESTVKVDKIGKKMNADVSDDEAVDDSAVADSDDEVEAADSDDEVEADDSDDEVEAEHEEQSEDEDAVNEEESDDDDDEEQDVKEAPKVEQNKQPKGKHVKQEQPKKKGDKRYVLFVGNLPYDVTKPELHEHFQKVGEIKHIRIPTEQKTNRPRGFAYVEVHNEIEYQKALSLHHTSIKGRRINVLYTEGGKKMSNDKKDKIKQKNVKLHAMRSKGMLAGSVKDSAKRSARRAKKNASNKADT